MANNNAQAMTLVANTAQPVNFAFWADYVYVENQTTAVVYVRTDGTAATVPATGAIPETAVPVGGSALIENAQARLNSLQYAGSGGLNNDAATKGAGGVLPGNGVGLTSQTVPAGLWASGFPTTVSVIGSAAGLVLVEPR